MTHKFTIEQHEENIRKVLKPPVANPFRRLRDSIKRRLPRAR